MSDWIDLLRTTRFYDDKDKIWIVQNEFQAVPNSRDEQWLRLTHIWYYDRNFNLIAEEYDLNFDSNLKALKKLHVRCNDEKPVTEEYVDGNWYLVLDKKDRFADEIKKPKEFYFA